MYQITQENIETYQKDGYVLLKNAIDMEPINALMESVIHVISLEAKTLELDVSDEEFLNKVLIDLKRKNPSSSSWIYQSILGSYALRKFFIDINIEEMAMSLLGIKDRNNLGVVSPSFRFDIPGDVRNVRTWHQDGNYFLENQDGDKHTVAWIPTSSAYKDNGSVIIAPGSHKRGGQVSTHQKSDGFASEQYTASEDQYKDYDHVYIEAEPGDIAFIHMDLLHSSGVNITEDNVRYTAQIRFNTINDDGYRPVFLKPEYPTYERNR